MIMKKNVFLFCILFLFCTYLCAQSSLTIIGGLDSSAISRTYINGNATCRIIIETPFRLVYKSNMDNAIPKIGRSVNYPAGIRIDTLYFITSDSNNKRIITIYCNGYTDSKIGPLKLYPKWTYKYKIKDSKSPDDGFYRSLFERAVYFTAGAGVSSDLNHSSIGIAPFVSLNIKVFPHFYAGANAELNCMMLKDDGQSFTRRFMPISASLKYLFGDGMMLQKYSWMLSAGYTQSFIDMKDSGFCSAVEMFVKSHLVFKVGYSYMFSYSNSIVSLSVGYCF